MTSGGASAVKEPGRFEVRKSSRLVRLPGVPDVAKVLPVLTDLHCTYCIPLLKHSNRQIIQPGHMTWHAIV